jgi:hypothetical protein
VEIVVPATRRPHGRMPAKLYDLESRMPTWHSYRHRLPVTWAHETTHGLNSHLRNRRNSPRINAFYIYDGRAILATEPDFLLSDAASQIPRALRGRLYRQYAVSQTRYWDDRPLYLFDEWCAYQNGSLLALDINETSREDSLESCIEMLAYCTYVTIGVVKNGVRILPETDVQSAYVKLASRLATLCSGYAESLTRGMQARINSYVELLYGTEVEEELTANDLRLNQFMFSES